MNEDKTIVIVQARLNSTRMPRKVLSVIEGKTVVQRIFDRLLDCGADEIVFAVPEKDDELAEYISGVVKAAVFQGPEHDVLERVCQAAAFYEAETVIDITADCPMVDPVHIGDAREMYEMDGLDYISNTNTRLFPDGFDFQIYRAKHLFAVNEMLPDYHIYRAHTGWNIFHHRDVLDLQRVWPFVNIHPKHVHPEWRMTLDTHKDLKAMREVYQYLEAKGLTEKFEFADVMEILLEYPYILRINEDVIGKIPGEG